MQGEFDNESSLKAWGFKTSQCTCCGVQNSELSGLLMQCGKCKQAYYCSSECFNKHFPVHTKECNTGRMNEEQEIKTKRFTREELKKRALELGMLKTTPKEKTILPHQPATRSASFTGADYGHAPPDVSIKTSPAMGRKSRSKSLRASSPPEPPSLPSDVSPSLPKRTKSKKGKKIKKTTKQAKENQNKQPLEDEPATESSCLSVVSSVVVS